MILFGWGIKVKIKGVPDGLHRTESLPPEGKPSAVSANVQSVILSGAKDLKTPVSDREHSVCKSRFFRILRPAASE